ncbi:uncharacterized Golgi apparatus membrane protein-like protein CG5021 isoform X2 [Cylas formicarius]|uniref:uncharacterized Golgi apparatus membrane protein-like protein CG5021 isoform X2 n=1 Tax=Cylas formicarius TaxID=197179 RepID=UPI00295845AB|nr:uncharacterized Golgi apparatus membrane protein-like protein CG5021 isoform X2 [Cylas formicarius]
MSSPMMPLLEDDTIVFGEEDISGNAKNYLAHPYVTLFHVGFRAAAIVAYMLCGWFSNSFITSFVVIVILLSMDFWTVKNITGRLMVGLRWWNYVDDDGKSHWVYESRKNRINERESRIFWTALVLTPFIWGVFFLIALFGLKLKWMLVVLIALSLNGANLHGYIRCKVGNQQSLRSITSDFLKKQVLQNAVSIVTQQNANPAKASSQPTRTV